MSDIDTPKVTVHIEIPGKVGVMKLTPQQALELWEQLGQLIDPPVEVVEECECFEEELTGGYTPPQVTPEPARYPWDKPFPPDPFRHYSPIDARGTHWIHVDPETIFRLSGEGIPMFGSYGER